MTQTIYGRLKWYLKKNEIQFRSTPIKFFNCHFRQKSNGNLQPDIGNIFLIFFTSLLEESILYFENTFI